MHKYQVVYVDPPWKFHLDMDKANNGNSEINVSKQYSTMSIDQLKNLEINTYQVIYADPPWHFHRNVDPMIKVMTNHQGPSRISPASNYSTMAPEEISALPIKDIVAKDAACFMWTTDAHMPSALEIMKAWGFQYKTIAFIWIKKSVNGKTVNMLAPWTMKGAEICLLGTRGTMTKYKAVNNIKQVHEAVRREHSRKPDIIRDEIARMFPECRKIELFARTAMPGWDAWGNEVEKFSEPEKKKVIGLF